MATTTQTPRPQVETVRLGHSPMKPRKKAIWEWKIVQRAVLDAFLKLNPRKMMGNPVMFVVEIGSVITTMLLFKGGPAFKFNLQITLWLWFTVLFANFAEAMAEGRGKAQADTLRKARMSCKKFSKRDDERPTLRSSFSSSTHASRATPAWDRRLGQEFLGEVASARARVAD